ncbi:MAG TPA: hypothetical protein VJ725_29870 [Thermoanaerobaculia bacterium]|nr:hypothetical protein [Thermoanaerobaculia bacterium]
MKARNAAAVLALIWALGMTGTAHTATVELISKADPVPDIFGDSSSPSFSSDGRYVLFGSTAPNLVPGQVDRNSSYDLFLHDRVAGTTTLVTQETGSPTTTDSSGLLSPDATISADGRYVAYSSARTSFDGGTDTNSWNDVFLWDRVTGTTTLVSHAAGAPNAPADGQSVLPRISADGEWVAFTSFAKNLVPRQTEPDGSPSTQDVFLWSRSSGAVTLVSRRSDAPVVTARGESSWPEISADGRFVAFVSSATDLVSGLSDTNSTLDVFVFDRSSGAVSLVSRASDGSGTAFGFSSDPRISADGRFIAFTSLAVDLVPGQMDSPVGFADAFLFDRVTGEMRLASHTGSSPRVAAGMAPHLGLALSADGRALAFASLAVSLVPGQADTNGSADVFVYDRLSGSIELASHVPASPATATAEPVQAGYPSLSADGRFVTFSSARNLVPGETDSPGTDDVFLYDRSDKSVVLVSHGSPSVPDENGFSTVSTVSPDGSAVAFSSTTAGLGGIFDPNGFSDVFVYSRSSAETAVLSRRDPANPGPVTPYGPSTLGDLSADGQTILFWSLGTGLVPGQIDEPYRYPTDGSGIPTGTWDAFLVDRAAGKTILLSHSLASPLEAVGLANLPMISADGRFAAFAIFVSSEPPLITGAALQLYEKATNTAILVNHKPGAPAELVPGDPGQLALSADGRNLAYSCNGCRALVPGYQSGNPANLGNDLFLYDRVTDTHTLVSHASGSPLTGGNQPSYDPVISADGRFVAFASSATNLVAGQSGLPDSQNIFLFDRTTGGITLVSHSASSAARTGNQLSLAPVISADGRFIAFRSAATDLVPGQADANEGIDVFLWDRIAGTTSLVSHASSSPTTAGTVATSLSYLASVGSFSADGRFLIYESPAADLISGGVDTNGGLDVFLYDLATKSNTLVSHALGAPGTAGNKGSAKAQLSADGRRIAFVSLATDLVAGQAPTGFANLILQDRITGARTLVGRVAATLSTGDSSLVPRLSADGGSVAFTSDSPGFVTGDLNADLDVFLYRKGSDGPVTVPPCTLFDTRRPVDGPALRSGVRKTLAVRGACGVPASATAVTVKVTVPQPRRRGNLRILPGDALLRFQRRQTRTGTFTVPLAADGTLALQATVAGNGAVHGVVEVVGYVE